MSRGGSSFTTGLVVALATVVSAAALCFLFRPSSVGPTDSFDGEDLRVHEAVSEPAFDGDETARPVSGAAAPALKAECRSEAPEAQEEAAEAVSAAQTEEEREQAEEERRVEAFDALTDSWREPLAKDGRVSMEQIETFRKQFKTVPDERKEECLQRAFNLIPDENVMVLAGLLFDKGIAQEYVELVFQDVLNRDETYKKPVLQEIFKDKSHPCWTDAAWILDVTGELSTPQERQEN